MKVCIEIILVFALIVKLSLELSNSFKSFRTSFINKLISSLRINSKFKFGYFKREQYLKYIMKYIYERNKKSISKGMINAKFRLTPVKIKKSYKSYISTKASKVFSSPENGRTTRHGYLPISVDQTTEEKKGMNFPLKLIYGGWNGKFLADDSTE